MQTSTMNPGQPVEFYNDSGAIEEGVIVEGPSYRALSGCTINKYSNGSMGTWGQGLRVRYEMSDEEGVPMTDRNGRAMHGIKTVPVTSVVN